MRVTSISDNLSFNISLLQCKGEEEHKNNTIMVRQDHGALRIDLVG